MNPIFIAGLVAAWFLSACRSKDEELPPNDSTRPNSTLNNSRPDPNAIQISAEPLPAPAQIDFGGDLEAYSLFRRMLDGKAPTARLELALDRGCASAGGGFRGSWDDRIEACELRKFVVDSHLQYPKLASDLLGAPPPWSLDDGNPATPFDARIRSTLGAAIEEIKASTALQGKDPSDFKYQEILARGIFHFVRFPAKASLVGESTDTLQETFQDLSGNGLEKFLAYILENGGLGLAEFPEHSTKSLSAWEALKRGEGDGYSMANVLYAALESAGLQPHFFQLEKLDERLPNAVSDLSGALERQISAVGVAISLGGTILVLDPRDGKSHISPSAAAIIPSDRYLASLFSNRADHLNWSGKAEKAAELYRQSLEWVKDQAEVYNNLGVALHQAGKTGEAEAIFRKSLRLKPDSNLAYFNLAWLLEKQGHGPEALGMVARGLSDIDAKPAHKALATRVAQGALKRNPRDAGAKKLLNAVLAPPRF